MVWLEIVHLHLQGKPPKADYYIEIRFEKGFFRVIAKFTPYFK